MSQAVSNTFGFGSAGLGGGGGSISGPGTVPRVPKYISPTSIGDSQMADDGTTVYVGTSPTSTSALFEVKSTTQGALFPRMTTTQRDLIPVGATEDSMFIYNLSSKKFNYYDAFAGTWITIESSIIGGETWAETLTNGAISGGVSPQMSNGDVLKAVNGGGQLDLRNGANNIYALTNDGGAFGSSWVYGDTTTSQIGYSTSCFKTSSEVFQATTNFNNNADLSRITGTNSGLFWELQEGNGVAQNGVMGIYKNTTASFTTANKLNTPAILVSQNSTSQIDVTNAIGLGGIRLNMKTNNTAYGTQFGYSDTAIVGGFETIINFTSPTIDRTQTIQNKSGTIALLSDITAPTSSGIYAGSGIVPTTVTATLTDTLTFGTDVLYLDEASTRVGIGRTSVAYTLDVLTSGSGGMRISNATKAMEIRTLGTSNLTEINTNVIGYQFSVGAGGRHFRFNSATASNAIFYLNGALTGFDFGNTLGSVSHRLNTNVGSTVLNNTSLTTGDVQIKGLTNANLLFTNASTDRVGINTASPTSKFHIVGVGATSATSSFLVQNSGLNTIMSVTDDGKILMGIADTGGSYGNDSIIMKVGSSNQAVSVTNAPIDGSISNTAANVQLVFTTRDNAGSIASTSQIWIRNRSVNAGSTYGVMVIGDAIQTENPDKISGRTIVSTRNRHTNSLAAGVLHIENRDNSATAHTLVVDSFLQNTLLSFAVRSGNTGNSADTWNWRLKNNHEFEHNFGQLSTGDFIMRGLTDVNLFHSDASANGVAFGRATATAKIHITGGTATAGTSSLKFTTGTLMTVAETGAMEFASDFFYLSANSIRTAISTFGRTVVDTATYSALITDRIIGVTRSLTGICTINLPSAGLFPNGYELTIMDEGLNATNFNITIDPSAAQLINGNLNEVINVSKDSRTIYSNGVDAWFIK